MKIEYQAVDKDCTSEELVEKILEASTPDTPSLVSGAHQLLLPDGRINTFGEFAKITGELAAQVQALLPSSKLFLQMNDQLGFRGLNEGTPQSTGIDFWQNPWSEIREEGHKPQWGKNSIFEAGINTHGKKEMGLVSEWALQRWHVTSGLRGSNRFRNKKIQNEIHRELSVIPQEALQGSACRANGCAHEIMVEAPFCIERGYKQLIGFWPLACKGSVLFGSTLATIAMERRMKGPEGRDEYIQFEGPFKYIHVLMNTYNDPQTLEDTLIGASICTISTS